MRIRYLTPQFTKSIALSALLAGMTMAGCSQQTKQETETVSASAETSETTTATASSVDTLKKIADANEVVLGYYPDISPFSFVTDDPNQPMGYSHDLAMKITENIKKELQKPDLKVRFEQLNVNSRFDSVQQGKVDLVCGVTTNTNERQQKVAFSNAIFQVGTRLLTKKNSVYKSLSDLMGKTIAVIENTTSQNLLNDVNKRRNLRLTIITAKSLDDSLELLNTGQADALMYDDVLLAGMRAKSENPDDWLIVGSAVSFENYGCMLPKGDSKFKQVVNQALTTTYTSGEIFDIYTKWFEQPIPPNNINLKFPMSADLKNLINNPTDKSAEKQF